MIKPRVLLLYNPSSGKRKPEPFVTYLENNLNKYGEVIASFNVLEHQNYEFIKSTYKDKVDVIVICGGDGTLNRMVNVLYHLDCLFPILFLAGGSTNDVVKSYGIPSSIEDASKLLENYKVRHVDLGLLNNKDIFIYALTFGTFTEVTYETPQNLKNKFGHSAYWLFGLTRLTGIQVHDVSIDGKSYKPYVFGSVTNATTVAHVFKHDAEFDDGLMELMLIKKPRKLSEFNETIGSLVTKKYNSKQFKQKRINQLVLKSKRPIQYNVDGEEYGTLSALKIEVLDSVLSIIV